MKSTVHVSLNGRGQVMVRSAKCRALTILKSTDWLSQHTTTLNFTDSLATKTGTLCKTHYMTRLPLQKINYLINTETLWLNGQETNFLGGDTCSALLRLPAIAIDLDQIAMPKLDSNAV